METIKRWTERLAPSGDFPTSLTSYKGHQAREYARDAEIADLRAALAVESAALADAVRHVGSLKERLASQAEAAPIRTMEIPAEHTEHEDCNCEQVGYVKGWNAALAQRAASVAAVPVVTASVIYPVIRKWECPKPHEGHHQHLMSGQSGGNDVVWCTHCGNITYACDGLSARSTDPNSYTTWLDGKNALAFGCDEAAHGDPRCSTHCGSDKCPVATAPPAAAKVAQDSGRDAALVQCLYGTLRDIANPIEAMRREVPEGYGFEGAMAIQMANDPQWYKRRAQAALDAAMAAQQGEKEGSE